MDSNFRNLWLLNLVKMMLSILFVSIFYKRFFNFRYRIFDQNFGRNEIIVKNEITARTFRSKMEILVKDRNLVQK